MAFGRRRRSDVDRKYPERRHRAREEKQDKWLPHVILLSDGLDEQPH
jgi:hypothetical protein